MGIILRAFAGFLSGIVSGMGIGGGVVLIPFLTLLLGFEQKTAQGINLLYFIPTGFAALWIHIKNKSVDVRLAWILAAYGVAGSIGGALLAGIISSQVLRKMFAVLIIVIGCNEFFLALKKVK
ncbi:MAG: hypothetical protein BWY15_02223 [Firmicutes bacterium ADurb.Bin193]|nr:MAG: hypothetical protein BWY15_02223 [Firmicutes bacterium ADurb.Bin193]